MKTYEEIKEIVKSYQDLTKYIKAEVTTDDISVAKAIINSFRPWNNFAPYVVAETLGLLMMCLPKKYYNEGNPNNGRPIFTNITIHSDSLITITPDLGYRLTEVQAEDIRSNLTMYGKRMMADERTLIIDDNGCGSPLLTIRLWWD